MRPVLVLSIGLVLSGGCATTSSSGRPSDSPTSSMGSTASSSADDTDSHAEEPAESIPMCERSEDGSFVVTERCALPVPPDTVEAYLDCRRDGERILVDVGGECRVPVDFTSARSWSNCSSRFMSVRFTMSYQVVIEGREPGCARWLWIDRDDVVHPLMLCAVDP